MNTYAVWLMEGDKPWKADAAAPGDSAAAALEARSRTSERTLYVLVDEATGQPTILRTGETQTQTVTTEHIPCVEVLAGSSLDEASHRG